jgi:hypothetical protein
MARDKFTKLRAARLTSKPTPAFSERENTKPDVAISEKSPITDTQRVEENQPQPSALSPTDISDKLSAVAAPSSGKFRRARLSAATKQESMTSTTSSPVNAPEARDREKLETVSRAAAAKASEVAPPQKLPAADVLAGAEVETLETVQLPVVSKAKETTLAEQSPVVSPETREEIEKLQTRQIPLMAKAEKAAISGEPSAASTGPRAEIEKLQTLHMPAHRQEITTTAALPVANASAVEEVEQQDTLDLSAISSSATSSDKLAAKNAVPPSPDSRFAVVRRLLHAGLARLQEPQPEGPVTRGLQVLHPGINLGQFPLLTLTNALGLILVSVSYYLGSFPVFNQEFAFLLGVLFVFVPNLLRLLSPATLRLERVCLLCGLGLAFYLIGFMGSPLHFSSFDEFLHWVSADNILQTHHLFSYNSMLPVSSYYPGLEILTNAISSLTGLGTFYASIPLLVSARLLMVLSLFLFYEQITGSSRMAGIATIIYMINPHFIFFDSIFSYETLALPLTICAFYILARYENSGGEHRWVIFTSWIVLMAIAFTHHMTDYVFDGLLLLWATVSFFTTTSRRTRIRLSTLAVFGAVLSAAYAFLVNGNPVWSYLSSYFDTAFIELGRILTGTGPSRPLFGGAGGTPTPIWDRLFMTGSVAIVAFGLPFGLLTLWRLHRRNALPMTLGIFALAYPVAQAFRFTTFGPEIADRSAAFLFLAVAYVLTLLITHFWPTRGLSKKTITLLTCTISVVLLGGVILDLGPGYIGLPGPYMVGADGRSIEPEGINDALWALAYLGPGNRIGTDRVNQMLMSTYGEQHVITQLGDLVDVSPLFFSMQFDTIDRGLLRAGQVHYLVVDMRMSTAVPASGIYFVSDEPDAGHITIPISKDALTKFTTVPQINRLFDSGHIVIYDTGAFLSGAGP